MSHPTDEHGRPPLTQREIEVIKLVADGLSNQEIADALVITVHTVKVHLKHIFAKLETNKRTQAVAHAREIGLLRDETVGAVRAVQPSHTLPHSLIPLIGRDKELSVLAGYLSDANHRLITVHGPGGIGKTHLAIEAARQHVSAFRDGVFMVSLEPLDSALFLLSAIAETFGFQFSSQGKRKDQLLAYLSDKQTLLVMDGFEHLRDNTALIGDLLAASTELKVMVTSRERLNIHGEVLYSLQGVSYPREPAGKTEESDAVTLFRYCVARVLPEFEPDEKELAQIADICRFVEGLPLGILLAASWINAISIQGILTEIQQQAHILDTDALSTLFQYKGLQYVFQRSWDLLEPCQRDVFMRLAVFRGSFTRDAAQQVAAAPLRTLSALVNKAMLEWDPRHKRYHVHRLFQQYGLRQLQAAGVEADVREAHFNFFAEFAQSERDELDHDPTTRQAWDYAIADLRAALQWACGNGRTDRMIELCLTMNPYWTQHGYFQECFDWLAQALGTIPNPSSALHARALRVIGETALTLGKPTTSRNYIRQSILIWHRLENPDELCHALTTLGDNEHVAGNYAEAVKTYEQVLEIARETGNKTYLIMGLHGLGLVADARQHHQQALVQKEG
jgi:predicted ATPase/DNA-binding CsgD family transcriptional regulator